MNALRVVWKFSKWKDKFLIAVVAISPALIVLHAWVLQSRGLLAKGVWAISALLFFFVCIGVFALIVGIYREAKNAKVVADRIKSALVTPFSRVSALLAAGTTCVTLSLAHASDSSSGENLLPRCGGMFDLCGYEDRNDHGQRIAKTFERASMFSEGLAAVRIDGLFGYIDTAGNVVIRPTFDLAGPFHEGFAEVLVGGQAGVIARNGDVVVQPQFRRAVPAMRGVFVVQTGKYAPIRDPEFESLDSFRTSYWSQRPAGLYRLNHGWVTREAYKFEPFGGDLVWAQKMGSGWARYGLMRSDGRWHVEPAFDDVQPLRNERAIVTINVGEGMNQHRLWGSVDQEGRVVIPLQYDWLSYWQQNYSIVRQNGREGFIGKDGKLLGGRLFDKVQRDDEGKPSTVQIDDIWYGIRPDGEIVEPPPQRAAVHGRDGGRLEVSKATECKGGLFIFAKDGLWGMKYPDGRVLVEPEFSAISCFSQGVAWVPDEKRNAWCAIGPDGRARFKPDCRATVYPASISHHHPEKLDPDPFKSSVKWMRAYLGHAVDQTIPPPLYVGDGVQGQGSFPASCRQVILCGDDR
ncbi:hypothetical protein ASG42_26550 [Rhizobium sp. Leaf391]|uniref:WG repeat-containing protein n=1 Tax=Rhizobium sp. Leaf391 TaxID=1736360 RepID=UPI000713831B|nr:WG repeat-containing protein [Rhizobium sp. Leaf391]KQT01579.1 hypothetical protein ASG42_26550 [Rhizobium sp. Leaf391]